MLIKSADDKTKRLRLLEELQASPVLDSRQRDWLKDEFWRVKKGIEGERDNLAAGLGDFSVPHSVGGPEGSERQDSLQAGHSLT